MKIAFWLAAILNLVWGCFMVWAGAETGGPSYFFFAAINLGTFVYIMFNSPE